MYYINKIVGFTVSPLGIAIAGCVVSLVCARLRRMRMAKWMRYFTIAWVWLWMTPFITWVVGVPLECGFLADGRVPAAESYSDAEAIVLLGGSMAYEEFLSPHAEMSTSADRVWQAARLWKAGKAPRIIATGDGARESTLGLLKDFGVDEKCVEFLDARNTEEEARGVGALLTGVRRGGVYGNCDSARFSGEKRRILLVTSAWHTKRAAMMFEKYAEGIEVVCAPADFEMSMAAGKVLSCKAVLPDAYLLYLNSIAVHEWVGIAGYRLLR